MIENKTCWKKQFPPRSQLFILYQDFKIIEFLFVFVFRLFTYLLSERGEGREKERERSMNAWLLLMHPQLGAWPATQACTLTGNQTCNPLVLRPALNPLSLISQGKIIGFKYWIFTRLKYFHIIPTVNIIWTNTAKIIANQDNWISLLIQDLFAILTSTLYLPEWLHQVINIFSNVHKI